MIYTKYIAKLYMLITTHTRYRTLSKQLLLWVLLRTSSWPAVEVIKVIFSSMLNRSIPEWTFFVEYIVGSVNVCGRKGQHLQFMTIYLHVTLTKDIKPATTPPQLETLSFCENKLRSSAFDDPVLFTILQEWIVNAFRHYLLRRYRNFNRGSSLHCRSSSGLCFKLWQQTE